MGLTWWWLPLLLVVVVAAVAGVAWWRARVADEPDAVLAAHTQRLTALPAYQAALRRYSTRLVGLGVVLALTLLMAAWSAGRPGETRTVSPERSNRDIMLCLDVSGSMLRTDAAILASFVELIEGFKGQRVGLMVFNNQTVTAFPLTDDYDVISGELERYISGFSGFGPNRINPLEGTFTMDRYASSLVPDGLASCVLGFDNPDEKRPRSVVLGTDNQVVGTGIYSMDEAVELSKEYGARVYAINPSPYGPPHDALERATEATGGKTYEHDDTDAVADVTKEIERVEAARMPSRPVHTRVDRPTVPLVLFGLGLMTYLGLAWRWRR